MQTGNKDYIYKNDLKACSELAMAYSKYKELTKRIQSDNVLRHKAFKMLVIQNMMDIRQDKLQ